MNEEFSELKRLGVSRLVLKANVGTISEAPVHTEIVLLKKGSRRVENEVSTDSDARSSKVTESEVSKEGPQVEEGLCSGFGTCVLKATLEVGDLSVCIYCLSSAIDDKAETLSVCPFLFRN